MPEPIVVPDRAAFKAAEVCELLGIAPYVLRSWENEFKDLGVTRAAGGPRIYRREDVDRALRIKHLMLTEGLTLAGVRRRLEQEAPVPTAEQELAAITGAPQASAGGAAEADVDLRAQVRRVRDELRDLHGLLASDPVVRVRPAADRRTEPRQAAFELASEPEAPAPRRPRRRPSA
jgi:DNA-binding transcriptional MerR regulator